MSNYDDMIASARESNICFDWQKIFKAMIADSYENEEEVAGLFEESVPSLMTKDQIKTMKNFAKQLIKDKVLLKQVNAQLTSA